MKTRTALTLASLGIVALFVFLKEHWGHALGALPYLVLLACPLLHMVGHGSHGEDHSTGSQAHGGGRADSGA